MHTKVKYILHIDTSADNSLIALSKDGELVAQSITAESRNQAATINNDINKLATEAGITLRELAAIAVCGGPGSYTGLRIGLSTAKGLCYALDIPLMVHNKLFLMLLGAYHEFLSAYDIYMTILPAREKEFFFCSYDNNLREVIAPKHIFEGELNMIINELSGKILITGNNLNSLENIKENKIIEFQSLKVESWLIYAFREFLAGRFSDLATAEPFYLKQVYTHNSNKIN